MKISKRKLKRIIKEELAERIAPTMGPGKSHGIHMDDRTGELIVAIEDELGASNFLDAVLQKMDQKQMKSVLWSIAKKYKIDIGYKQL